VGTRLLLVIVIAIAAGMILVERAWPANQLPAVRGWWARIAAINLVQLGVVLLAGITWDRWLAGVALIRLRDHLPVVPQALIAYLLSTFVYYWWHRVRHESRFFWRLCHQLHHSPQRIEILTSFFKHPVEITLNSILSAAIVYPLLGCDLEAGAIYTLLTAVAEYFYHWNVRTPHWLGVLIQRPESHRVHHQYRHHTQNFADLPVWDILFGTFRNPRQSPARCGFDDWREDRFEDLLAWRDVHAKGAQQRPPLTFLPTCIGCSKRWACAQGAVAEGGDGS
jgi:sterol desaturase/sphingolipid hydroxylase (fatty acid hydroxylase superfamily)